MQTSNNIHESWSQRIVILALLAFCRSPALTSGGPGSAPAATFARAGPAVRHPAWRGRRPGPGHRGPQTIRSGRVAEYRLNGVAAVRAADVAAPVPLAGLRGVAAVRSIDADQGR